MRFLTTFSLIGAAAFIAAPAVAQQAGRGGTPSVEGYLCTFAGKCDGVEAPQATRKAPNTKGFRLARPSGPDGKADRTAAVTSGSAGAATRPFRKSQGQQSTPASSRRNAYAAASVDRQPYAATVSGGTAGRPRADLLIGFELNSAQLTPEGRSATQVFARSLLMPELSAKRFLIEGHTDLRGGAKLNGPLSAHRAQAVTQYLVSMGVSRDRLETRGFGSTVPLPGHGASDPANRRVEAELIP